MSRILPGTTPAHGTPAGTGRRVRVAAFVAGGPIALAALEALAAAHEVAVVVRATPPRSPAFLWRAPALRVARALGIRPPDQVLTWARQAGVPVLGWIAGHEAELAIRIAACGAEVGCITTFPRRIPPALLTVAGRETLNLHPSLLPRHRGPDPLFWTYHAGDHEGGVSVHLATDRLDAGPVLLRATLPIGRGEAVTRLHARCANAGGPLLAEAVSRLADGTAVGEEQEESLATRAPRVRGDGPRSRLDLWSAEHAWHFLAGLLERYVDPLVDSEGHPVSYTRVAGYEVREPGERPGTVVKQGAGWAAWTRDGVVHLAADGAPG